MMKLIETIQIFSLLAFAPFPVKIASFEFKFNNGSSLRLRWGSRQSSVDKDEEILISQIRFPKFFMFVGRTLRSGFTE